MLLLSLSVSAQKSNLEVYLGGYAGNTIVGDYAPGVHYTDASLGAVVGVAYAPKLTKLFTVQGDDAILRAVGGVDVLYTPEDDTTFATYTGLRFDFPLTVEYGLMKTAKELGSYFGGGADIGPFNLSFKLINFNPYVDGVLISRSDYHDDEIELKRTMTMGIKFKF